MTTPMHNALQDAENELRRQQARLKSVRKKLDGATTKVMSRDRMVTVTLGVNGQLESIEFHTQKFRKMAPAELGSVIAETIRQAQAKTTERVLRAYRPLMPDSDMLTSMLKGTGLDEMMEVAKRRADDLMPGNQSAPAAGPSASNGGKKK
jgi:DNA-binding protein YbaB